MYLYSAQKKVSHNVSQKQKYAKTWLNDGKYSVKAENMNGEKAMISPASLYPCLRISAVDQFWTKFPYSKSIN